MLNTGCRDLAKKAKLILFIWRDLLNHFKEHQNIFNKKACVYFGSPYDWFWPEHEQNLISDPKKLILRLFQVKCESKEKIWFHTSMS